MLEPNKATWHAPFARAPPTRRLSRSLSAIGESRTEAHADVDRAAGVPRHGTVGDVGAQPVAEGARENGIGAVGEKRERGVEDPEADDLERGAGLRP